MDNYKDSSPTQIFLLRHGHVENPSGCFYSQQDIPLSKQGKQESHEVANLLKSIPFKAIFTSDLSRTLYLAELLAKPRNLMPKKRAELREVDFGKWSGLTWSQIESKYPGQILERFKNLETYRPPGGENMADVKKRSLLIFDEILKKYQGNSVAIVAHAGINRIILAYFLNMPIQNCFRLGQDYGCINKIVIFPDGQAVLEMLNWKDRII